MLIQDNILIGQKVAGIRKKRGFTQNQLSEAADLSLKAYANFERGRSKVRLDNFLRICSALDVTPDDILTEDDPAEKVTAAQLASRLDEYDATVRKGAYRIIDIYLRSLNLID